MTDQSGSGRPEVCVGAIIVEGDCLLLIRRGRGPAEGEWSIPGGHVEAGETLAEAVVREVAEETGLVGVCCSLVGWVERIGPPPGVTGPPYHFVIFDFRVILLGDHQPVAGDDAAEVAWVPLADVCDRNLVEGLAEFLHDQGILAIFT